MRNTGESGMAISVRLPRSKQTALARLAKTKGRSQSDLVRDAIDLLLGAGAKSERTEGPYESIAHLIGCADSGGREALSEKTGRRFAAMVQAKAHARRRSR
jgi:hypothetical protein